MVEGKSVDYLAATERLKALCHPVRLQIVHGLLKLGCRNVGCMEEGTGQSQPAISQHLTRLRAAGIVKSARSGNEVYYEIADPKVACVVAALLQEKEDAYVL